MFLVENLSLSNYSMTFKTKMRVVEVLFVILLLAAAWVWWTYSGGVSHRDICDRVQVESRAVQAKVDARADALERKLDRLEAKLDRLLKLVERPPLPDNMAPARE